MSFNKKLAVLASLLSPTNSRKIISIGVDGTPEIKSSVAAGAIGYFARNTAPDGWLKANGAAISLSSAPDLADIYCGDANNSTALWGYRTLSQTDPSNNRSISGSYIVLPDLRGEFPRGWDDGRGADIGRVFGSAQSSQNLAHNHTINDPGHVHTYNYDVTTYPQSGSDTWCKVNSPSAQYTSAATTGISINNSGGTEARPRNIALLACIKY